MKVTYNGMTIEFDPAELPMQADQMLIMLDIAQDKIKVLESERSEACSKYHLVRCEEVRMGVLGRAARWLADTQFLDVQDEYVMFQQERE